MNRRIEQAQAEFLVAQGKLRRKAPGLAKAFEPWERAVLQRQAVEQICKSAAMPEAAEMLELKPGVDYKTEDAAPRPAPPSGQRSPSARPTKTRGLRRLYRPKCRNKKTGEWKQSGI